MARRFGKRFSPIEIVFKLSTFGFFTRNHFGAHLRIALIERAERVDRAIAAIERNRVFEIDEAVGAVRGVHAGLELRVGPAQQRSPAAAKGRRAASAHHLAHRPVQQPAHGAPCFSLAAHQSEDRPRVSDGDASYDVNDLLPPIRQALSTNGKLYAVPFPYFFPYDAHYDEHGYTWTAGIYADRVARMNVETGEWNFYLLPFEANIRDINLKPAARGGLSGLWIGHTHQAMITLVEPLAR